MESALGSATEEAVSELAALCRSSFGPHGTQTLVFRPPDAPVVTGSGHAVLAGWREGFKSRVVHGNAASHSITRFVLAAAEGLEREAGDGVTEFVLLLDAAIAATSEIPHVDRRQLSRAFADLKWQLGKELEVFKTCVSVELVRCRDENSVEYLRPAGEFHNQLRNVLQTLFAGKFGSDAVHFLIDLVIEWVFRSLCIRADQSNVDTSMLFKHVQRYLKQAPDAVLFLTSPSLMNSYALPPDDVIIRQTIVGAQSNHIHELDEGCRVVCLLCPLNLEMGSNTITVDTASVDELFSTKAVMQVFIARYIRRLKKEFRVRLLICLEHIQPEVVAICTRNDIACVEFAESDEISALSIASGTIALASLFDAIIPSRNIGVCRRGAMRVQLQQRSCIRLCGLSSCSDADSCSAQTKVSNGDCFRDSGFVPQLLLHAPTKAVYKEYYAGIVEALRVLRNWWKPIASDSPTTIHCCRGAGAIELAIANYLRSTVNDLEHKSGTLYARWSREILAAALQRVVASLRQNLSRTVGVSSDLDIDSRRQVLSAVGDMRVDGKTSNESENAPRVTATIFDEHHQVQTLAGLITCPQLVIGDPMEFGLVHPWNRIEALLFATLQTLEQLFRIDTVIPVKRPN